MKLIPVKSSAIKAIGHDPATNTLTVEFSSGATHEYSGVTAEQSQELIASDSIGTHFSKHIRPAYRSRKLQ